MATIGQWATQLQEQEGILALAYVLNCSLGVVRTKWEEELSESQARWMKEIVRRRLAGEPLQYAIGKWEFYGHVFDVDERALIPRPETECLVSLLLKENLMGARIADVGTGTGVIAITLALEARTENRMDSPTIVATDLSTQALSLARQNATRLLGSSADRIQWVKGDGVSAIPGKVDIIVSNPPYIDPADRVTLQPELFAEPQEALFAGETGEGGLFYYRNWIPEMQKKLRGGGRVFLEIGDTQGKAVQEIFAQAGYQAIRLHQDYTGRDRVVQAVWGGTECPNDDRKMPLQCNGNLQETKQNRE